jgi:acyl dehydratase
MAVSEISDPVTFDVERGAIGKFARALGETDPVFFDPAAARAQGYRDVLAPPTFPMTFTGPPVPGLTMPSEGNIHGEQEFTYHQPIVAGDRVTVTRGLTSVRERDGRSGRMRLVTIESTGTDEDGKLVFTSRQVIIVRLSTGQRS